MLEVVVIQFHVAAYVISGEWSGINNEYEIRIEEIRVITGEKSVACSLARYPFNILKLTMTHVTACSFMNPATHSFVPFSSLILSSALRKLLRETIFRVKVDIGSFPIISKGAKSAPRPFKIQFRSSTATNESTTYACIGFEGSISCMSTTKSLESWSRSDVRTIS